MLVQTNKQIAAIAAIAVSALFAGCSESGNYSHFVFSEQTESLMREAQNGVDDVPGVKDLVDQRFGNPQALKAWAKLPIDFGGQKGSVAAVSGEVVKELELTLEGELTVEEGQPAVLQFITGDASPGVVSVEKWSSESGMAALSAAMEVAPKAGDLVVVNGGRTLSNGRGLYMRHCSHCHGTSGDGAGPTAEYLQPKPRDYRHGKFKFTSTGEMSKASRDDLKRILTQGIPGTYMPSFVPMLDEEELHIVVEYIRFLAMRGEFERGVGNELRSDFSLAALKARTADGEKKSEIVEELKAFLQEDLPDGLSFVEDGLQEQWSAADSAEAVVVPSVSRVENTLESRRRGRELFLSAALKCTNCHGVSGKGDGPQTLDFETDTDGKARPLPGLYNDWGHVVHPRNLTTGIYRGGRRPVDIFRRIYAGIKGAKMPAFGGKNTSDEDIWNIVNYVLSIPFEAEPGKASAADGEATAAL